METKQKSIFGNREEVKVDPNMPDYSNHPFFLEKKRKAIEFLEKHPIPKELLGNYKKSQD
jgi:hypothetical protein